MTEPEDPANRIEQLRTGLLSAGEAFLNELWLTSNPMGQDEVTERDKMSEQAWFVQQFDHLSQCDRRIILEVIRLQVLNVPDFASEELTQAASRNPGYAHQIIGWAQQLQTMEEGKPLLENMNICEAIEVVKRHLHKKQYV